MQPVWKTTAGAGGQADGGINASGYDGSRIYGSESSDSKVFSLGLDGAMKWSSQDDGTQFHFAPIAIGNGVVWSVDPGGSLVGRNTDTGVVLIKLSLGTSPSFGGMSLVGGAVYVDTGIGPPPGPLTTVGPDTSRQDSNGTIIAYGDTSRSGATAHTSPSTTVGGGHSTVSRHRSRKGHHRRTRRHRSHH
jgi:outer membrane protein assembly factor BamB